MLHSETTQRNGEAECWKPQGVSEVQPSSPNSSWTGQELGAGSPFSPTLTHAQPGLPRAISPTSMYRPD